MIGRRQIFTSKAAIREFFEICKEVFQEKHQEAKHLVQMERYECFDQERSLESVNAHQIRALYDMIDPSLKSGTLSIHGMAFDGHLKEHFGAFPQRDGSTPGAATQRQGRPPALPLVSINRIPAPCSHCHSLHNPLAAP